MVKKVKIGKIKNLSMENIDLAAKFRGGLKRGIVKTGLNKSGHGKWSKELPSGNNMAANVNI